MQKLFLTAGLIVLLLIVGILGWRAEQERKVAVDRVRDLELSMQRQGVAVPPVLTAESLPEKSAVPTPNRPVASRAAVDVGPYLKMIDELRKKTQDLDRDLHEARVETAREQGKASEAAEQAEKLSAQFASLREEAQSSRRLAEVYETELKAKSQRLIQAETGEKVMQERLNKAELAARRTVVVSKDVEDLNRRREAAFNALQRRYREVTDLYRNFSLNAQNREAPGATLQAGDLSRIQSALQQAEDELRQVQALNARVAELSRAK